MNHMLLYLIQIICTLFTAALLLGAWFYWLRIPAFNPLVANVMQITNWLVVPLRNLIPSSRRIDTASFVAAYLTAVVQLALIVLVTQGNLSLFAIHIPLEAVFVLAKHIANLIFWLTLIYAIMSWINPMAPAMTLFRALLEPILTPIRNLPLLNQMRGIDFSPLVLIVITQLVLIAINGMGSLLFKGMY